MTGCDNDWVLSGLNQIDFATPAQWRQVVARSADGKTEKYELDFGGGHKVFTFVIWAADSDRGGSDDRGDEKGVAR